jgi:rhodanese-related sulfurtransferase
MLLFRFGVVMLAVLASSFGPGLANEIDAKSAYSLAQSGQLIIIDIRRPSEWRRTGIPDGSAPISLQHFSRKIRREFFGDVLAVVQGDKSQSIGLICARGGRSAWALELLEEVGFSSVHDISEGMFGNAKAPGWLARDLPITVCDGC